MVPNMLPLYLTVLTASFRMFRVALRLLHILVHRGLKTSASRMMLAVSIISFLLATLQWADFTAFFVLEIRILLDDGVPLDAEKLFTNSRSLFHLAEIFNWVSQLLTFISDCVVVWRAWAVFPYQRWLMLGPLALLLGTSASGFAHLVLTSSDNVLAAEQFGRQAIAQNLFNAFLALSLATNALATFLMAYKLWTHRKSLRRLGLRQKTSPAQTVLILLTESGAIYCGLQLINLVMEFLPNASLSSTTDYVNSVILGIYISFTAMYPTMIAVLVHKRCSIADAIAPPAQFHTSETMDNSPATPGHLSFA
ncbi:hypothetical protein FPV67DRAFT_230920 [Lyophyllum atratum]|nr:hypothetical protein FPV67DRAFT_230920 [Lyophyllum atratum]